MDLRYHFVATTAFALILLPFFGLKAFLVYLGGFFVDVDHYLYNVAQFKDFSLKKAYLFYSNGHKIYTNLLHIFHTIEFWILLAVLGFFYLPFALVFFGLALHMVMDGISHASAPPHLRNCRANSFFKWLKTRKKRIFRS